MNTFSKNKRLLEKSEYDQVFSQSKRLSTSDFIILYRNTTIGHARLGLAIAKKVVPKAHDRNRLKRLLRETFRTKKLASVDIIVLAKRGVDKIQSSTLLQNLNKAWDKLLE